MGLRWREEYSVGVDRLDEQHQGLVLLIERLHHAMLRGASQALIGEIVEELVRYAGEHFASEERRMEAVRFPELDKHQAEHAAFLERARWLHERHASGQAIMGMEVMGFLQDWLVKHILDMDQRYVPYLSGEIVVEDEEAEPTQEQGTEPDLD